MSEGAPPTVRTTTFSDGPEIGALFARSCRQAYTGVLPAPFMSGYEPGRQGRIWTERIAELPEARVVLAAEADEILVGFAHLGSEEEPSGPDPSGGEVLHLFVDPAHQRTGAGRSLLGASRSWFAAHGLLRAGLWVFAENHRARSFYEAVGWHDTGVHRPEPDFLRHGDVVLECRYSIRLGPR